MRSHTTELVAATTNLIAKGTDTGVKIRMDAPWMGFMRTIAGQIIGTGAILTVVFIVIAAIVWGGAKAFGAGHAQNIGVMGVIIGIIVCVLLGSAASMVMYFTGFNLFA